MKEEYVTCQQAVALKECGFDWECDHYYTKENAADDEVWLTSEDMDNWNAQDVYPFFLKPLCSAPTQALAQKWLREVKVVHVLPTLESVNQPYYVCHITQLHSVAKRITDDAKYFNTYEAALSAGIDAALELIKKK